MKLISLVIAVTALLSPVYGQSQAVERSPGIDTVVEIAEQAGCPLKLSVKLRPARISSLIGVQALSDKPIIGYILVQSGETVKALRGIIRPGDPVAKDKEPRFDDMGVVMEGKDMVLRVDYVEFADGTSWGEDALKQAAGIKQFARGWNLAMGRLREAAAAYEDPEFFIRRGSLGGLDWVAQIPPIGMRIPGPRDQERMGYDSVLKNLRLSSLRQAEAEEIARTLELMRTPYPTDK